MAHVSRCVSVLAVSAALSLLSSSAAASALLEYSFDDGADPTANSGTLGSAYDGDLVGNAFLIPSGGGFSLFLDGDVNDNSVVLPLGSESAFDIGDGNFALFAAFQTTLVEPLNSNLRALISKESLGDDPGFGFGIRPDTGLASFYLADGTQTISVDSTTALNDGALHTLLAVRDGNLIGLILDGILEATLEIPVGFGSTNNDGNLVVGGNTLGTDDDWAGQIFGIGVHGVALMAIPEPSTAALVGLGLVALRGVRRRD